MSSTPFAGLEDAVSQLPERWAFISRVPRDEVAVPGEVTKGFRGVAAVLTLLGPSDAREVSAEVGYGRDGDWFAFKERFADLRTMSAANMNAYLVEQFGSANAASHGRWSMQGWLRDRVGHIAKRVIMDVPAWFNEDPTGLREVAFEELQRVALLLPDRHQAGCLRLILERVEMRAFDFARRLYHHPDAGPAMKAVVHEVFEPDYAAKLIADVPESHAPSPWA